MVKQSTTHPRLSHEEAQVRRHGAARMAWGLAALVILIYGLGFWLR